MPAQLLQLSADLKAAGLTDCLQLLHFHMGSQISNVRDIAGGMREAVRYFVELHKLGHPISHHMGASKHILASRLWAKQT